MLFNIFLFFSMTKRENFLLLFNQDIYVNVNIPV